MGHSVGDGMIVVALAFALVAYLYFRHQERQRRLEVVHQERLAAMEKGIPLPELPLDGPTVSKPPDRRAPLIHGIVWLSLGAGAAVALRFLPNSTDAARSFQALYWPLPLPLAFLGVGLILYYFLASDRSR